MRCSTTSRTVGPFPPSVAGQAGQTFEIHLPPPAGHSRVAGRPNRCRHCHDHHPTSQGPHRRARAVACPTASGTPGGCPHRRTARSSGVMPPLGTLARACAAAGPQSARVGLAAGWRQPIPRTFAARRSPTHAGRAATAPSPNDTPSCEVTTDPSTATPNAEPTCQLVDATPAATQAWARRHPPTPRVRDRRVDHPETAAEHHVGGDHTPPAKCSHPGRGAGNRSPRSPPRRSPRAACTLAGHDPSRDRRQQRRHRGHRQREQPGVQRRVAADVLQVERVEEEEPGERGERRHRRERRGREGMLPKKRGSSSGSARQTPSAAVRPTPTRPRRTTRRSQGSPPATRALDDPEGQTGQYPDHQQLARRVEAPRPRGTRPGDETRRQHDDDHHDRDVQPEHRPPAHGAHQEGPDQRSNRLPRTPIPDAGLQRRSGRARPPIATSPYTRLK